MLNSFSQFPPNRDIGCSECSLVLVSVPGLFESLSMLLLAVDDNDGDGEDVTTIDTPGDGDWFTETSKADF